MKKCFMLFGFIAFMAIIGLHFTACDSKIPEEDRVQLEVLFSFNNSIITVTSPFPYFDTGEGGPWTGYFIVKTDQPIWQVKSNQTWCVLDEFTNINGENGFNISFDPIPVEIFEREVTITITTGNAIPVTFSIKQKGGLGLYFGTWRSTLNDGSWGQFIINAEKIIYMDNLGYSYIMSELTWTETVNQGGDYTTSYPTGYRITGKLTAINNYSIPKATGSGNAAVGEIAAVSLYLYTGKGDMRLGNTQSVNQEALYGPFSWKHNAEYWQVTWNLDGGAWPVNPNYATQVAKDGKLAEPKAPIKSGVYFSGWYKEASLINQVSFPYNINSIKNNFTLYAKWGSSATLRVTINASNGFYTSISAMPVSGGAVQTSIPTSIGTHTVSVPPGTYYIFSTYFYYPAIVENMRTVSSGNFTVTSGQTKNINFVGAAVGFP